MRLSGEADGKNWAVFLDGERLSNCTEADDAEGWAMVLELGPVVEGPEGYWSREENYTQLTGKVEFKPLNRQTGELL